MRETVMIHSLYSNMIQTKVETNLLIVRKIRIIKIAYLGILQ